MDNKINGVKLATGKAEEYLNNREIVSYREHRRNLIQWLLTYGKNPNLSEGYAQSTVKQRAYRLDKLYRKVWRAEGQYTEDITTVHADAWMTDLAESEYSRSYKVACQKAVKSLFKWKRHAKGRHVEWDPLLKFSQSRADNPRDFLTRNERQLIREASLSYGSVPHYSSVTPGERDRWKRHLAQRFGIPKAEVGLEEWNRANSWKVPSIIWTAMDAGLRPIEVGRARVSWVDLDNGVLRIPKEDSAKNTENWTVSLLDRTALFLEEWLAERELYDKYEHSDLLWLTRCCNPYSSRSLNRIFRKLCHEAGINLSTRDLTWYSIRHSVGTYMTREEDLAAAAAQLRHKSVQTTMIYDQTPIEDRRDALERMG